MWSTGLRWDPSWYIKTKNRGLGYRFSTNVMQCKSTEKMGHTGMIHGSLMLVKGNESREGIHE